VYANETIDSIFNLPISKAASQADSSSLSLSLLTDRNLKEFKACKNSLGEQIEMNFNTEHSLDTIQFSRILSLQEAL
jgi:hypothetical protein